MATGAVLVSLMLPLCPNISLIFLIRYLIIVGRSSDSPHAITRTSSGNPIGRSISGRNIPLFPTSTHFFRSGWNPKTSRLGSVYGLNAGLNLMSVIPIW